MLNKIFIDLDETLISGSAASRYLTDCDFTIALEYGGVYDIKVRPSALDVIKLARSYVGLENVYLLTIATREYATEVSRLACFDFPSENIIPREEIHQATYKTLYGGMNYGTNTKISHSDNVLIDNLPARENEKKMIYIGIKPDRYLSITPYYGTNFEDDDFYSSVEEFLLQKSK
jgi:hypothetical protein